MLVSSEMGWLSDDMWYSGFDAADGLSRGQLILRSRPPWESEDLWRPVNNGEHVERSAIWNVVIGSSEVDKPGPIGPGILMNLLSKHRQGEHPEFVLNHKAK